MWLRLSYRVAELLAEIMAACFYWRLWIRLVGGVAVDGEKRKIAVMDRTKESKWKEKGEKRESKSEKNEAFFFLYE